MDKRERVNLNQPIFTLSEPNFIAGALPKFLFTRASLARYLSFIHSFLMSLLWFFFAFLVSVYSFRVNA